MKYVYLFIKKDQQCDVVKYGIKLSDFCDSILTINNFTKKAMCCYLNPKDSPYYANEDYNGVKIIVKKDSNCFVVNNIFKDTPEYVNTTCSFFDYVEGTYEQPVVLITTSVVPEEIFSYNRIIDYPINMLTSAELYYSKTANDFILDGMVSSKTTLLSFLDFLYTEDLFDMVETDYAYIYIDKKSNKKYTITID
ncbi:MAG: hypothetical protein RSB87_00720 [Clostridia bacterium]